MGRMQDDLQFGIFYPLGGLSVSLGIWHLLLSSLCRKMQVTEKTFHGTLTTTMYLLQWTLINPHAGKMVPLAPSMDVYLFLAAGYYLRCVTRRGEMTEILYCAASVYSILDVITYRRGGDAVVCYLFLTEFPDILITIILRFTCSEAIIAITDSVLHVLFRVILFAYLLKSVMSQPSTSEDIKMNIAIIHGFSYTNLPSIIFDAVSTTIGNKLRFYRRSNIMKSCCALRRVNSGSGQRRRKRI